MRIVVAVLCLLVALVGCSKPPPAYESKYTEPAPTRAAYEPAERPPFDPGVISAELRGRQPYVISVLGDSTGNNVGEWVHLVAEHIAVRYGRVVTVHDWNIDRNAYEAVTTYGTGGAPVTIWNGSGPGKPAQYSQDYYRQMAPEPVNVTLISHGHNGTGKAPQGVAGLVDTAYANTLPGGGVVVVMQNPRTDAPGRKEQEIVDVLRRVYSDPATGVAVVDVNTAFRNAPDLAGLLRTDGVHPNEQGSRVWAETVISTLRLN